MSDDLAKYIPAGFRALQHLGEIKSLQTRAAPHVDALLAMADEARSLYAEIFPEDGTGLPTQAGYTFTLSHLQDALNRYGGAHLAVDGKPGQETTDAIKAFQKAHNIEVDGWAGMETMSVLFDLIAKDKVS